MHALLAVVGNVASTSGYCPWLRASSRFRRLSTLRMCLYNTVSHSRCCRSRYLDILQGWELILVVTTSTSLATPFAGAAHGVHAIASRFAISALQTSDLDFATLGASRAQISFYRPGFSTVHSGQVGRRWRHCRSRRSDHIPRQEKMRSVTVPRVHIGTRTYNQVPSPVAGSRSRRVHLWAHPSPSLCQARSFCMLTYM